MKIEPWNAIVIYSNWKQFQLSSNARLFYFSNSLSVCVRVLSYLLKLLFRFIGASMDFTN